MRSTRLVWRAEKLARLNVVGCPILRPQRERCDGIELPWKADLALPLCNDLACVRCPLEDAKRDERVAVEQLARQFEDEGDAQGTEGL